MNDDTKQEIEVVLSLLKGVMTRNNLMFGIIVDKNDFNKSQIAFLDKNSYRLGKKDGIMISLDEMNNMRNEMNI